MSFEVLHKIFPERRLGIREDELFIFAGPCVVENETITLQIAEALAEIRQAYGIDIVFKASFMKANRTSKDSFTGLPLDQSLSILQTVKVQFGLKVLSDVHEYTNLDEIADVVDVLQTPAFLVRQTEFLKRVAAAGKPINIKKGQFLSPTEMISVVDKIMSFGNSDLLVCERGSSFGYNYLINDFRGMQQLMQRGQPLVFDATHSVQRPGALGDSSGGDAMYAPRLAKAAVALGVDGVFLETHPDPATALSDGPNMIPLALVKQLLGELKELHQVVKGQSTYI
ncbi:2-Keto-3-deoxy-D-manno-octulosonate-8-phosphate synthase [Pseudomonas chlororaphis subsp. aurantiaca]|uniref:3-deoxy-8-phosphooctulonate synthase n=1 Tax=Pseudomonas chlororaphis subsp. aurantiaca TaxID=86192 RepID=A0AAJ1E3N7_9PSED|nr:3-deoxy-8-phosphooctulonate synthase [Pseudomonas chlororaphis]AZD33126.1 2-Keto-3-deoxy-D-manno-octulosonate-8-phosphate synthase [Pseudomonas chlororaphis subsp. aurantiaca]AZD39457.1 2-Keto-3-deoxy-D-manno-octulosonate-8-phosphate synthase [Pseudomonas chlororaphis subsp. aurantiaca]AZD64276.1 2-Keto-3-deoxy-D-manno-octulosonate-8-phosphate synthase [Pseudomonas chlororaphis subsp. aurantiaca]AZD76947.1 2-Keto-3-deoxy-D-manno-octulosonate-8-phosphate synthase [Pseudomonas chlororaphis sub